MRSRDDGAKRQTSDASNLLSIDPALFEIPVSEEERAAAYAPVDVAKLLRQVDSMEAGDVNEADFNDPTLLAELARVQRGVADENRNAPGDALAGLREDLENEREAMALFESEGEDTSEMAATIARLQTQIAAIEGPARQQLDARVQELRQAAAAWKRAGDKERAIYYLRQSKEATLDRIPPAPQLPPPPVPQRPHQAIAPAASVITAVAAPEPVVETIAIDRPISAAKTALEQLRTGRALRQATEGQQWERLVAGLSDEARSCNSLALELKEAGHKQQAVECFRRQKEALQLLQEAAGLRNAGSPPPEWDRGLVHELRTRPTPDPLAPDEGLLVQLSRGGDVLDDKGEPVAAFVRVVCAYPTLPAEPTVVQSPTADVARSPEWNWSAVLPVSTQLKSFRKHCERKDLRVELWAAYGWLRGGNVCLGVATVPLAPLLQQSVVSGVYDVIAGVGHRQRAVGARLELAVRSKWPLLGPPSETVRKLAWIQVRAWPAAGPSPEAAAEAREEARLENILEHERREADAAPPMADEERIVSARVLAWMADELSCNRAQSRWTDQERDCDAWPEFDAASCK